MSTEKPQRPSVGKQTTASLLQRRTLIKISLLLLLWDGPGHGYDLSIRLGSFGFDRADTSTVYSLLRRLEDADLVASTWDLPTGAGPARRVYEITATGKEELQRCTPEIRIFQNVLEEFFARHPTTAS